MLKPKVKINNLLCLFIFIIIYSSCSKETRITTTVNLLPKKYNEACFLMTHNAMNNTEQGFSLPNQSHSITNQLKNGVRGLMIDTYDGSNGIALTYHANALFGQQKLVDVLQEVKTFLNTNTKEVVTIIFQNDGSNAQLQKAIDSINLSNLAFIHNNGNDWPTLQTMVDSNRRLVMFVENNKLPRASYLMHAWSIIFDTKYTYTNANQFDTDINRGRSGSKELYLVNHWLQKEIIPGINVPDKSLAPLANASAVISKRVQDCSRDNNHFINFLGVDFYEIGDAKTVVDSINTAD